MERGGRERGGGEREKRGFAGDDLVLGLLLLCGDTFITMSVASVLTFRHQLFRWFCSTASKVLKLTGLVLALKNPDLLAVLRTGSVAAPFRYNYLKLTGLVLALKNPALLAVRIGSIAAPFRYNYLKRSGLVLNSKTPGCLAARVTSVLG